MSKSLKARLVLWAMLGLKWTLQRLLKDDDHRRIVKCSGGVYFLGKDSVWYVGPDGQRRL